MNPTQTTQQIKMDPYQKWLNGESFCECGEKACGTYGPDNKELCEECRDDEGWCSCGNKEEECDVCGEDDWEECEDCGYTHHYEDKCPVGEQCKMYEKWTYEEMKERIDGISLVKSSELNEEKLRKVWEKVKNPTCDLDQLDDFIGDAMDEVWGVVNDDWEE